MGKKKKKQKGKSSLIKQLSLIIGIVLFVVVISVVVIKAINKTTIKTITVEGAFTELYIGNPEFSSTEVGVSVYPETASKASLMAYSMNPEIANVSFDGEKIKVEAVGVGTTNIIVRHASKSSLYDSMQVTVKDVDVQGLTFVQEDGEGILSEINSVDIKKDGFEHFIPFNLDPIDANMNNLKINDFNTAIFDRVEIDQSRRSLVVVPKTDIVQTSAEIDVEIYQNTSDGYRSVQVASLMVNLLNREAHIRFNLSSDPSRGYSLLNYTGNNSSNDNIVYLEQSNNASDVYVLPEIGYDINFESVGHFNINDYVLSFDGIMVDDSEFNSQGVYEYKNKIAVNKSRGNFYYFNVLNSFSSGDCIYVDFTHKYTGATAGLQFIYLEIQDMGLASNQEFAILTPTALNLGDVVSLNFSYDKGVNSEVVDIYTFRLEGQERIETDVFGDGVAEQTIKVKKDNKKISLWAQKITNGTTICFGVRCNYWDARYVRINEDTYIPVTFTVSKEIKGVHIEQNGLETNLLNLQKGASADILIVAEPEGGIVEGSQVSHIVKLNGVESDLITILNTSENLFNIKVDNLAVDGTYTIEFEYKGIKTTLFVVV